MSSESISFVLKCVSPMMATLWLEKNVGNRDLSSANISKFARDMIEGKWSLTHQCIAFDCLGNLIDGQHRLHAIIESGEPVEMYVAHYRRTVGGSMVLPFDTGRTRTTGGILKLPPKETQTARVLILCAHNDSQRTPSASEIGSVHSQHAKLISRVCSAMQGNRKIRSTAHSRAAIVLRCLQYPTCADEIIDQFRMYTHLVDVDGMWPSVVALMRFADNASPDKHYTEQVFLRTFKAFCPKKWDSKVSRLTDPTSLRREVRDLARKHIATFGTGDDVESSR